jgi:CCR4-NOT transcription complex subunit 1
MYMMHLIPLVFTEPLLGPQLERDTLGVLAQASSHVLRPEQVGYLTRVFWDILLNALSSVMNPDDVDYCLEVRNACLQIHPRLMTLTPNSDVEPGFTEVRYAQDIDSEVDSIYKQMYVEQITIDEVIALLQRTKSSHDQRDHEIFSCMLHFLFDEYKFFQSYYPARELAMTGYLIQHQIVDYIPLGIAIHILDALTCAPDTNLFKFGLTSAISF